MLALFVRRRSIVGTCIRMTFLPPPGDWLHTQLRAHTFPTETVELTYLHTLPSNTLLLPTAPLHPLESCLAKWNRVFVKLNGKAPTDAKWIVGGRMDLQSAEEVWLALGGSRRVQWNPVTSSTNPGGEIAATGVFASSQGTLPLLATNSNPSFPSNHVESSHIFLPADSTRKEPAANQLTIRKYYDITPGMEFRCFLRNEKLVGTSIKLSSSLGIWDPLCIYRLIVKCINDRPYQVSRNATFTRTTLTC